MGWLWTSLILSLVLTVVLNVVLRVVPGLGQRVAARVDDWMRRADADGTPGHRESGVRVIVPWKAMIIGSIVLTILVNLIAAL